MKHKFFKLLGVALVGGTITPALALNSSLSDAGINALKLHEAPYNLLGRKIGIGQVEIGRPGKYGTDKVSSVDTKIKPKAVFFRNKSAKSDSNIDNHAVMVAGVMISQDKLLKGVAPLAQLYATAVGSFSNGGQAEECLASQHIAQQNGGDVRAINFSFGESLERDEREEDAKLDGKALLTKCIDWSGRVHDTLYVIAGNQGTGGIPIPTDNFNGITTAYTTQRKNQFVKVDFANLSAFPEGIGRSAIKKEINFGDRRAISLLAPGSQIVVQNQDGKRETVSGTSFAAPHITASVALLQEYGDRKNNQKIANWTTNSRRHEVMKAILLNSADKIKDAGDGSFLGMERTTVGEKNTTWLDSDAYINPRVPLDMQMGTGHLNVFRAYQQMSSGQITPQKPVPLRGWNYGAISVDEFQDYYIEQPLKGGSHAAITLTWDRLVNLNDLNHDGKYNIGETFSDRGLNNLDLYLIPADESSNLRNTCSSISYEDSVEHIFCPIPVTGRYKIRVHYHRQLNEPKQNYGLAWWTVGNDQ
jgi:Subtilase family